MKRLQRVSVIQSVATMWSRVVRRRLGLGVGMIVILATMSAGASPADFVVTAIENPEPTAGAAFGRSASELGDVNGDGVRDIVVGASGAGLAWVLSGRDGTTLRRIGDPHEADLTDTPCEPTATVASPCYFGYSVAGIPDFDDDGIDDLAVGAPGPIGEIVTKPCDPQTLCASLKAGRVELFSGATGATLLTLYHIGGTPPGFGVSLESVRDVDEDGKPELAIGALGNAATGGGVTLVSLSRTTGGILWTASPQFLGEFDGFGLYLTGLDDLTGDGRPDLLVGAPFFGDLAAGRAYVLSGADGNVIRTHENLDPLSDDLFGASVENVGDVTGDGLGEYAVGEPGGASASVSLVHLFDGATGDLVRSLPSPVDRRDLSRIQLAGAGDQDADGSPDLWVAGSGAAVLMTATGTTLATLTDPLGGSGFGAVVVPVSPLWPGPSDALVGGPGHEVAGAAGAGAVFLARRNRPPDCSGAVANPQTLWGPDLRFVSTTLSGINDPEGDPVTVTVTSIRQDERMGVSAPDGIGVGTSTAMLRAERDGSGDGRVYHVGFTAGDGHGGTCSGTVLIGVDHDARGLEAIDGGALYDSTAP